MRSMLSAALSQIAAWFCIVNKNALTLPQVRVCVLRMRARTLQDRTKGLADAIATAQAAAVLPSQMVALIDMAIAEAHAHGLPSVSYQVAGRSHTIALDRALELRRYYARLGDDGSSIAAVRVQL